MNPNIGPRLELHTEPQRQEPEPCECCNGQGWRELDPLYPDDPNAGRRVTCRACEGTGKRTCQK